MMSRTLRFTPLAICALVLAACQFQATTTIQSDGSGELRTEAGITAEERQNLESQSGGSGSGDFCNTQSRPRSGATVTEEQRGDETWCITATPFDSLDELRALYEEQEGLKINRLEIADERFYYDVDMDTSSQESGFSTFTAITWTVTLPGAPIRHNADQSVANSLTWYVTPRSGTINFQAESAVDKPRTSLPLVIVVVIVLTLCLGTLLGGAGAFFLMRRSRKPSA